MSMNPDGISCARCHAYLFPEDDVVYCPVCGAPHHRDCYNALGHCALEELHGTDRQYSAEKEREAKRLAAEKEKATREIAESLNTCIVCGEKYPKTQDICPKCGTANVNIPNPYNFDPLGGVDPKADIGEGITAEEAKRFVAANPHKYIPKFKELEKGKKVSWNWMAFLFPCPWFLSRKMYKNGIIAGILTVMATLFSYPAQLFLHNNGILDLKNSEEKADALIAILPKMDDILFIGLFVAIILELIVRIVCGLFGDIIYKNYVISSIKKIRNESSDMDFDYRKKGGVNIYFFIFGMFAVQYLAEIIVMFI